MVAVRQHLEGKARDLGDDVINARLEARGGFARDVVLEFVQQVADGEFWRAKIANSTITAKTNSFCRNQ